MGSTTGHLFRMFRIANSRCARNMALGSANVPAQYKFMFNQYTVTEWLRFSEDASVILDGENSVAISTAHYHCIQSSRLMWQDKFAPANEYQLLGGFDMSVLTPLSHVYRGSTLWEHYPPQSSSSVDIKGKNRKPDFALAGKVTGQSASSSSSPPVVERRGQQSIAVGEVKSPKLDLGSSLSTTRLNDILHHEEFLTYWKAVPFFQLFSYMLRTTKGIGVLTNYDQIRFFRINAEKKKVYMSPVVRVEQLLSGRERRPHTFQTFCYIETFEDQLERKEVKKILEVQLDKARRDADLHDKKKKEEEEAAKKAAKKAAGASSSSDHKRSKNTSKSGGKHDVSHRFWRYSSRET